MKGKKLSDLLEGKNSFMQLVILAIGVALGINLFSAGLTLELELNPAWYMFIGGALATLLITILFCKVLLPGQGKFNYTGLIILNEEKTEVLSASGYDFSTDIVDYINAIRAENKAIDKIWKHEPVGFPYPYEPSKRPPRSNDLITEATQYYLLNRLSLDVESYYVRHDSIDDGAFVEIGREDIPAVLLKNRFLELFSKPIDEREAFLDESDEFKQLPDARLVYVTSGTGAIFEHFELKMPKGSRLVCESDSSITIETNRFKINLKTIFDGTTALLPSGFAEYYLNEPRARAFKVNVVITVSFSMFALLRPSGWLYYEWVDYFLSKLDKNLSSNYFFNSISWKQTMAMIRALENQKRRLNPELRLTKDCES